MKSDEYIIACTNKNELVELRKKESLLLTGKPELHRSCSFIVYSFVIFSFDGRRTS